MGFIQATVPLCIVVNWIQQHKHINGRLTPEEEKIRPPKTVELNTFLAAQY
jgi:hypothetical protein